MVVKPLLDRWDLDLKDIVLRCTLQKVRQLKVVHVRLGVVLPHVTVGLADCDVGENFVLLLLGIDLDFEAHVLGDHGEQGSERVDEHLVDLVQLFDVVEISVSELRDLVHKHGVVVGSEPKTVDREVILDQILGLELLNTELRAGVLTVGKQEDARDVVLVFPFLDHLEGQIHSAPDVGPPGGSYLVDHALDLFLVRFAHASQRQNSLGAAVENYQPEPVSVLEEFTELIQGLLDEINLLPGHGSGLIDDADQVNIWTIEIADILLLLVVMFFDAISLDLGLDRQSLGLSRGKLDCLRQSLNTQLDLLLDINIQVLLELDFFLLGVNLLVVVVGSGAI